MISKPTTLILGAGASSSYGMPLGSALRREVLEILQEGDGMRRFVNMAGHAPEFIARFAKRFRDSKITSIDDFIAGSADEGREFVEIGRTAVALRILDAERKTEKSGLLDSGSPDDDWMNIVWNAMHGGGTKEAFSKNKLSIVTFNYDRTVETYFTRVLSAAYGITVVEAKKLFRETVPVVHVHGQLPDSFEFGSFPDDLCESELNELSRSIRVIHDTDTEIESTYAMARNVIAQSARACFLGFSFHRINTTRLALQTVMSGRTSIYACMFGMGQAECRRAERDLGVAIHNRGNGVRAAQYLRESFEL